MAAMKKLIENFLGNLEGEQNPAVIADELNFFNSDLLRDGLASLYECYLLNSEGLRFRRLSYMQPSWGIDVRISTCLSILNHYYLAKSFDDSSVIVRTHGWAMEAQELNQEQTSHYIMNEYTSFLACDTSLLQGLSLMRKEKWKVQFDEGPFHFDVFPFHFYSPEDLLLTGNREAKVIRSVFQELLAHLSAIM